MLTEEPIVIYQTESKPQCWRAVAIFADGQEALIFLGRSSTQVRSGYAEAFEQLLDEDEREQVETIAMQKWNGAPDAGSWSHHTNLKVPGRVGAGQLLKAA